MAEKKKGSEMDLATIKQTLLEKAKKDGQIDQQDIFAIIADKPENAEVLDQLYTELADASIEIISSDAPAADLSDDEWVVDEGEEEDTPTDNRVYLDDDVADDSVRLYLREIGKIPLLSAEEELTLARRIKLGSLIEAEVLGKTGGSRAATKEDDYNA